jgi:hypothetical protein
MRRDPIRVVLAIALVSTVLTCFWVFALSDKDWEVLTTKHYWSPNGFYYGGYASEFIETPNGYRTVQQEGLPNLKNVSALASTAPFEAGSPRVSGFPGTERLVVPFLVYLTRRLSAGFIGPLGAFRTVNVVLWLLAILMVYGIARRFYADPYAPFLAAIMTAAYPTFTLTFGGIKIAQVGTPFLLLGVYAYEAHLRTASLWRQVVGLTAMMTVGMFASGGWLFLACYLFLRQAWETGSRRWAAMGVVLVAVVGARLTLSHLTRTYELPSVAQYLGFSYARMLAESGAWLTAWWHSEDVSKQKLLNFEGHTLVQNFLPHVASSFAKGHAALLLLAGAACLRVKAARRFVVLAVPLFLLGHSGTAMTGWHWWHYGYLSAPAGIFLILAASGFLGDALARPGWRGRGLAVAAAVSVVLWGFSDQKSHAGLYYGGDIQNYRAHVIVYGQGYRDPRIY